jgi:hypothetical protein
VHANQPGQPAAGAVGDAPTIAEAFREAVLPDIGGSCRTLAVTLLDRIEN